MKTKIYALTFLFILSSLIPAFAGGDKSIMLTGEVAIPMGSFGDAANAGFGGTLHLVKELNENTAATATIGYATWGTDVDGLDFSAIVVQSGGRLYMGDSSTRLFVSGEAGIYRMSVKTDVLGASFTAAETKISVAPGAGVQFKMGETAAFEVTGRYQYVSGSFSNIGIRAGILFGI